MAMLQSTLETFLSPAEANVGHNERWLSAGAGVAALLAGAHIGGMKGTGLGLLGAGLIYRAASGYCSLYDALGISTAHERPGVAAQAGDRVCRTIELDAPVAKVFAFWRDLENLPQFMGHLRSVEVKDQTTSHWEAEGPLGVTASWDAQLINERTDELLAWQSVPGSMVDTAGSVHFEALGSNRTRVRVSLKYSPPGGKLGIAAADLLGDDAERMIDEDLRELKRLFPGHSPETNGGATRPSLSDDKRQRVIERLRRFILTSDQHQEVRGQSVAVRAIGTSELEQLSREVGVERGLLQDVLHDAKHFASVSPDCFSVVG